MNEIEKIKDETEKIKRDLWSLSNETMKDVFSKLEQVDATTISEQISNLTNQLENFNSRLTEIENALDPGEKIVIFDMESADETENLGFADGFMAHNTITNANIANCKYFKFYIASGDYQDVVTIPLPSSQDPLSFNFSHEIAQSFRAVAYMFFKFAESLDAIEFVEMSYIIYTGSSGTTARIAWYDSTQPSHGYVKKIEGFLK